VNRGMTAYHYWINDSGKRCQVVEDVNLQLISEEWFIRHH
jgi:hypothetical protein